MKLYYYGTEATLCALWDQELKVSSPCDFNDPFEFLPATAHVTPESRIFCQAFQGASRHHFYVLSMSERSNNLRMWAQYGANHTGIMLELDWQSAPLKALWDCGAVKKVGYDEPKRVVINPAHFSDREAIEILTRKGNDWAHEQEWRLIFTANLLEKLSGKHKLLNGQVAAFIPLPDDCISRVTVGHRSSHTLFDSIAAIRRRRNATWTISKAKLCDHEFRLLDEVSE